MRACTRDSINAGGNDDGRCANMHGGNYNAASSNTNAGRWAVYAKSRLGKYSAAWTESSQPTTGAIQAWLAEDMDMPLQNIRLRTTVGHMCTNVEIFPRLSGGGRKRERRGKSNARIKGITTSDNGQPPAAAPVAPGEHLDAPATWKIMLANAHGYMQRQGAEGLAGSGVDRAKAVTLETLLAKHQPAFVCVTETWMRKSDGAINVPGYRCYNRRY